MNEYQWKGMGFVGRGNGRWLIVVRNNEFGNRCATCDRQIYEREIAVFDPKDYGTMWHRTDECYPTPWFKAVTDFARMAQSDYYRSVKKLGHGNG